MTKYRHYFCLFSYRASPMYICIVAEGCLVFICCPHPSINFVTTGTHRINGDAEELMCLLRNPVSATELAGFSLDAEVQYNMTIADLNYRHLPHEN